LDAQDIMTFGIENRTYRHCRLPEFVRAPKSPTSSRVFNQQFRAGFFSGAVGSAAVMHRSKHWLASQRARMMNEIALRRKRRSQAGPLVRRPPTRSHLA